LAIEEEQLEDTGVDERDVSVHIDYASDAEEVSE